MAKNTIITNSKWFAENAIERDFLEAHENLESMGRFHRPISSAIILDKFHEKAESLGLSLVDEQARLRKDGRRFMYTCQIADPAHADYNMCIGFMNHSDCTKAFVGALGASILCCCNKLITNVVVPSRQRHTIGNYDLIGDKVSIIFDKYVSERDAINGQIDLMKNTKLTDQFLGQFALEAHKCGQIGAANIFKMIDDVIDPELNDKHDDSIWRLSNACTKVATHIIRSPQKQAETSKICHDIIMKIVDPTYRSSFIGFDGPDVSAEPIEAEVVG